MQARGNLSKGEMSRERILDSASRAIRRAGYAGASVADVMKEAGLTHGGFYAHFRSRDEMVAAAIAFAGKQSADSLSQSMKRRQAKGASPFRALIETYLSDKHLTAIETGCVVAALGSDTPRQCDAVRQAASQRLRGLIQLVESVLPDGVDQAAACHITSTMVGALQLARVLDAPEGKAWLQVNRTALLERFD